MNKRPKSFAALLLAILAVMAPNELYSATNTWTGLSTGNNWRQGSNWASLTIPAVGDDIVFAGTNRPNPNNNNSAVQGVFSSITFASTATNFLIVGAATPALTISNGITNNSVNTQTISNGITLGNNITVAASSGNINLVLAVGDAGAGRGITKTGDATLTLSGTNTYNGSTTIDNGAVVLSAGGSLSTNSALNLAGATARFDIAGLTASGSTNASLAGVAGSVVNLGSKNLNVGGNNTSTTFAGTITNTGSLTKRGSGTLTLSGANTYTGGTLISDGTLLFTNGGSVAGNITNNAAMAINRTDTSTLSNTVSGTGSLTKAGSGTLTLSGTNTFTGGMRFNGGTLELGNPSALAAGNYLKYESQASGTALVKVAYAVAGPDLGNLEVDVNGTLDLGTNSSAQIRFATATNWTVGTTLTITNSTGGGKLYILDATSLNLTQIVSAENPTYVASVDATNGLVTFIPPPPAGSTFASWLGSTSETSDLLLQYAFGSVSATQPVAPAYFPQASVTETGGVRSLVLTYYVRQGTQGLEVEPELSTDLSAANNGFAESVSITKSDDGISEVGGVSVKRWTASVPIESGAAKKFLRVRVTQN